MSRLGLRRVLFSSTVRSRRLFCTSEPISSSSSSSSCIPFQMRRHQNAFVDFDDVHQLMDSKSMGTTELISEVNTLITDLSSQSSGCRAMWFSLKSDEHSSSNLSAVLIPILLARGFEFYYGRNSELLMSLWLDRSEPNRLPLAPSAQLGVGGAVLTDQMPVMMKKKTSTLVDSISILAIREQSKDMENKWKLPGGLANPGESLASAVQREIKEETGVNATFEGVWAVREHTAFRQAGGVCTTLPVTDLYFLCRMSAMSLDIEPCATEVSECRWFPLREFVECEDVFPMAKQMSVGLYGYLSALSVSKLDDVPWSKKSDHHSGHINCSELIGEPLVNLNKHSTIYH